MTYLENLIVNVIELGNSINSSGKSLGKESNMKRISGKGTIIYDNGDVYEGALKDGALDGVGKMTYKDGRVCEGIWYKGEIVHEGELNEEGKPHGRGKRWYVLGFQRVLGIYEGEWKDGKKHGKGTWKRSDAKSRAECAEEWNDFSVNGKRSFEWAGGDVYEGEWKDDEWHGKGTYKDVNGDVYKGQWKANKKEGKGVMAYANQDIYDGEWKNGTKNGQGKMKFNNGDVYEGEFSNNKMHGKGTYTYAAGDLSKSIGEWKDGKKCGKFENIVRVEVSEQAYYDNDEVKANPKVKCEAQLDEDTDTEDAPPTKRRNICVSPPQV